MRKKWLMAGACLAVGTVMLLVSGFSAMANTSGYDAYKTALKNTKAQTSLTANVDVTVTDNGTKVLAGTAEIKWNQKQNASSMAATFGDGTRTHTMNVYRQEGKVIFKSGDDEAYRVKDQRTSKWQHKGAAPRHSKAGEQVFDALMGNLQELATVESEADGSKQAALHLSGSQIPAVVNALGTMVVSRAAESDQGEHGKWNHAQQQSFPKLTDNIKVESINLDAKISPADVLEQQMAKISISGTDESGRNHVLNLSLAIDFSGFDHTIPEKIDLTGKKIVQIDSDGRRGWNH